MKYDNDYEKPPVHPRLKWFFGHSFIFYLICAMVFIILALIFGEPR